MRASSNFISNGCCQPINRGGVCDSVRKTWLLWALTVAGFVACGTDGAELLGKKPYGIDGAMHVYRDFAYGPRGDLKGEGDKYPVWKDFKGAPYHTHRSGQLFDVYLPDAPGKVRVDAPVLLYLHGGAWCMRWDKDAEGYQMIKRLCEEGFVVCSMNYQLQNDVITDEKATCRPNATFADMLRDVDLMVTHLKTFLPSIGVMPKKIAIGGGSAGGHLSALYACDQANPRVLALGLRHDIPIGFELDVIGPMNFLSDGTREAVLAAARSAKTDKASDGVENRFVTLLGWLAGADLCADYREKGEKAVLATLHRWSPISLVTPDTPPFVLAYNKLHPFSGTDGLVETSNCTDMEEALEKVGVESASRFCWFRFHGMFTDGQLDWIGETCADFARRYMRVAGPVHDGTDHDGLAPTPQTSTENEK